jgi:adenylate kinase
MTRKIILITGTPSVGKTTVANALTPKLNAKYIDLTTLALEENLIQGKDEERDTIIIDEANMKNRLKEIIQQNPDQNIIIDGHYATMVVPKELTTHVFVLRRNPTELRQLMEKKGTTGRKLWENLASEILDVCLIDALNSQDTTKICELDISHKQTAETVSEILAILNGEKECSVGIVDWIGTLESQGILDECLRI